MKQTVTISNKYLKRIYYSFSLFQLFQWKMSNFLSPFHSLHLFQQFQADCVYKESLEDACYLLLRSVTLVFYSFSFFSCFSGGCPIFSLLSLSCIRPK